MREREVKSKEEIEELSKGSDSANAYYDAGMDPVGNPVNSEVGLGLFALINKDARNLIFNLLPHNDLLRMRRTSHAFESAIGETPILLLNAPPSSYTDMFSRFQKESLQKVQDEINATEEAQEDYQDAMGTYIDARIKYKEKKRKSEKLFTCGCCGLSVATCGSISSTIAYCVLGAKSAPAWAVITAGVSTLGFLASCVPSGLICYAYANNFCVPTKPTVPLEADFQPDLDGIRNAPLHTAELLRDAAQEQRGTKLGR